MFGRPYDARLRTDPAVGNVQGVQRYGRPLKTDPDQGDGYSYHVYPVAHAGAFREVQSASNGVSEEKVISLVGQILKSNHSPQPLEAEQTSPNNPVLGNPHLPAVPPEPNASRGTGEEVTSSTNEIAQAESRNSATRVPNQTAGVTGVLAELPYLSSHEILASPLGFAPFDATRGIRNYSVSNSAAGALHNPLAMQAAFQAQAVGLSAKHAITLYHQPLIQIKLRVVEVDRADGFQARSILDYISRDGMEASDTTGQPLHDGRRNESSVTNFVNDGLISAAETGSGALINLTTEHLNHALSVLATEFNGDVVTAPEVVTLNGQNVEFVSGSKVPFHLGQNVIQGSNNNIQQFFYKNVGTYVSVTPKIVNWGFHGEGGGEASIAASEVKDWNALATVITANNLGGTDTDAIKPYVKKTDNTSNLPIPFSVRTKMLQALNDYSRSHLVGKLNYVDGKLQIDGGVDGIMNALELCAIEQCAPCAWKPEDCTIDLSLVVRLSDTGKTTLQAGSDDTDETVSTNVETNVRAVSNIIQVKSGEGVVMAGLIGNRDEEAVDKIPVLGDLPYVGALFRSKEVLRRKTELLIFIEANVLDRRPEVARAQSAEDFRMGYDYVDDGLLDNALELGMQRIGFGSYLPPIRHGEEIFWERHGRNIQRIQTHVDDFKK